LFILGDYYIRAYWCKIPFKFFPIIASAVPPEPEFDPYEVKTNLVSVSGPGMSLAYCHENADFVVDGHEAGPGNCTECCVYQISKISAVCWSFLHVYHHISVPHNCDVISGL